MVSTIAAISSSSVVDWEEDEDVGFVVVVVVIISMNSLTISSLSLVFSALLSFTFVDLVSVSNILCKLDVTSSPVLAEINRSNRTNKYDVSTTTLSFCCDCDDLDIVAAVAVAAVLAVTIAVVVFDREIRRCGLPGGCGGGGC